MLPQPITSRRNAQVVVARELHQPRERQRLSLFLAEGPHLVGEALRAGCPIETVFYTAAFADRVEGGNQLTALAASGARLQPVSTGVMDALADTKQPQGVVAVVRQPAWEVPVAVRFVLVLDAVQDPGNVGTLLRIAQAAGVEAVWLTQGCADPWCARALRASTRIFASP